MFNIGIDIIENKRISNCVKENGTKFIERILTSEEINLFKKNGKKNEFLTGRFCVKEAFFKATNKVYYSFQDISVINNSDGEPIVLLKVKKIQYKSIAVSISHSKEYTVAICLIEKE